MSAPSLAGSAHPPDGPAAAPIGWTVDALSFTYPGSTRPSLVDVSVEIRPGECTAVLGPNGSGKSTFLRLLLGTLTPDRGDIRLGTRPIAGWTRRDLALTVGVVPQHEEISFPLTVGEMVSMGRYPHLGPFRPERAADRDAVHAAMTRCDIATLSHRHFDTLSGGERQRARLARALAQEPRVLALDEPTRALDVRHEMELFELLRGLASGGATVLLVTHNLNLASRYADRLVLLSEGRLVGTGTPADLVRRDLLETVYGWPLSITTHPGPGPDTGSPQVTPLAAGALAPPR